MEVELFRDGEVVPGLAAYGHGSRGARDAREQLLQRRAARQPRPVPHGLRRRSERARASSPSSRSVPASRPSARATTAASAPTQQRRYTDANAETQFSEPATGGTPDEQPGAMPEIFPSRTRGRERLGHAAQHRPLLDLPLDVHAGLGPLRHRLGRRAPAARRAAAPRSRPARGRAAGAARTAERGGREHPPRRRARRTCSPPMRAPLHDQDGHRGRGDPHPADRAHAAAWQRRGVRRCWTATRRLDTTRARPIAALEVSGARPTRTGQHTLVVIGRLTTSCPGPRRPAVPGYG